MSPEAISAFSTPYSTEALAPSSYPSYQWDWGLDTSTKFAFCFDSGSGQVKMTCIVQSCVIWLNFLSFSDGLGMMWGVSRKRRNFRIY